MLRLGGTENDTDRKTDAGAKNGSGGDHIMCSRQRRMCTCTLFGVYDVP